MIALPYACGGENDPQAALRNGETRFPQPDFGNALGHTANRGAIEADLLPLLEAVEKVTGAPETYQSY